MDEPVTITRDESTDLRRDLERVRSELRQLRADLGGLTEVALRAAKSGAAEAKERIDHSMKAAADMSKESIKAVEGQVAAHPLVSLASSFAIGLIVGLSLSRKD